MSGDLGGANKEVLRRQLHILRKAPHRRTPEDVQAFAASLSRTKFFQDLGDNEQMQVCQHLKLEGAPRDTTLFKQGDPGDKFYLILCGSVGIFIKDVEAKDVDSKTEANGKDESKEAEGDRRKSGLEAVQTEQMPFLPAPESLAAGPSSIDPVPAQLAPEGEEPTDPVPAQHAPEACVDLSDLSETYMELSKRRRFGLAPGSLLAARVVGRSSVTLPNHPDMNVEADENDMDDRKGAKQVTIAPDVGQDADRVSSPDGEGKPEESKGEAEQPQQPEHLQRSESRLSARSAASENSDADLAMQLQNINKAEGVVDEDEKKSLKKVTQRSLMKTLLSRPLMSLKGPKLVEVAVLQVGDCFGEIALQTDQPRAATVKTRSDTIFATLVREDYKSILHSCLQKIQQDRQAFLRSIPLLASLPNIANLAALMQSRLYCRQGILINLGTPVMHIYLISQGSFSVRGQLKGRDNKKVKEERRRRPSELDREREKEREKAEKVPVSKTVLSLLLPGSTYGLSHFLKGEREHVRQVICETAGSVFTLFAKDVAVHMSSSQRSQVKTHTSAAEESFFRQRCMALGKVCTVSPPRKVRCWPPEQTLLDKIREFTDVFSTQSIYSPEGRLRAVGSAFLEQEAKRIQEERLAIQMQKGRAGRMPVSNEEGMETHTELPKVSCWHMQHVAEKVVQSCRDTDSRVLASELQVVVEADVRRARKLDKVNSSPPAWRAFNPLDDDDDVASQSGPANAGGATRDLQDARGSKDLSPRSPPSLSVGTSISICQPPLPDIWKPQEEPDGLGCELASEEDLSLCDFFSERLLALSPISCSPREFSSCSTRLGSQSSRGSDKSRPSTRGSCLQWDALFSKAAARHLKCMQESGRDP
ncbi:unnamed protein product [Effrenium voratum]|uniref:Cyclic nucleotide-binding domain-containing protein n=1 Tax=Effrenium voratum TaxID=2562239 RepID=A0AA36N5F6_9DINO|nr:unnamed protein product [Effrenium voratum]